MANVIIGIHGLGNKPPKKLLEYWWKLAMLEGLKSNKYSRSLPQFELVYWADILHDKPFSQTIKDPKSQYFLKERYLKAPKDFKAENHDTRKKLVDFMNKQVNHIFLNEDFSLNYSFITDAIVNKYFHDLEVYYTENCSLENEFVCKARDLIKERLLQVLEKYKDDNIMLISHSMGSIIAYDVLSFLAPHIQVKTFITIGSPLGLPIVISKIAAEQNRRLNGQNHMITPSSITENWFNFADILDKVAFNYALADDFTENYHGVKPVDFLVVNNYETKLNRNPHKSYGYLRTPEFSRILNEFILSEKLTLREIIVRKTKFLIKRVKSSLVFSLRNNIYIALETIKTAMFAARN